MTQKVLKREYLDTHSPFSFFDVEGRSSMTDPDQNEEDQKFEGLWERVVMKVNPVRLLLLSRGRLGKGGPIDET